MGIDNRKDIWNWGCVFLVKCIIWFYCKIQLGRNSRRKWNEWSTKHNSWTKWDEKIWYWM